MVSFTHRFFLLILDSSFCHKLSLPCYSSQPFKMHLWFTVLSFSSSLLLLGFSWYCPLCSPSKGKMNSACWGISPALHRERRHCGVFLPGQVCSGHQRHHLWAPLHINGFPSKDKNKTKPEKWLTPVPREIKEEREGDRNDTTTSFAWGHRGHDSQGIK